MSDMVLNMSLSKIKIHKLKKHPPEVFYKKGVLKNFARFTEKHLCQSFY